MSSIVTPPPAQRSQPAGVDPVRRMTPDEYRGMIDTGELPEGHGYELIEGVVVKAMPQNPPHATGFGRTWKRIFALLPVGVTLRTQVPITIGDSEPEPDVVVARGSDDDYTARHPGPADVVLVVEVADSSRLSDRRHKQRVYARAGLPVYWIVNIPDRQVEVYTDPRPAADPPGYAARADYTPGQSVPLPTGGAVAVSDLLP